MCTENAELTDNKLPSTSSQLFTGFSFFKEKETTTFFWKKNHGQGSIQLMTMWIHNENLCENKEQKQEKSIFGLNTAIFNSAPERCDSTHRLSQYLPSEVSHQQTI